MFSRCISTLRTPSLAVLCFELLSVQIRASAAEPLVIGSGRDGEKSGTSSYGGHDIVKPLACRRLETRFRADRTRVRSCLVLKNH